MRRLWGFESQLPYEDWSLRLPLNSGANMKMIEAEVSSRPLADDRSRWAASLRSRLRFHTDGGACCCRARRCAVRSRTWRRFRCGGRARGSPRPRGCRLTAAR